MTDTSDLCFDVHVLMNEDPGLAHDSEEPTILSVVAGGAAVLSPRDGTNRTPGPLAAGHGPINAAPRASATARAIADLADHHCWMTGNDPASAPLPAGSGPTSDVPCGSSTARTVDDFADLHRWVTWASEQANGRITKVPYSPSTGRRAKVDDPATWGSFDMAMGRADFISTACGPSGVGFVLGDLDGDIAIGGIDLDTCRDVDGVIAPWAQKIIDRMQTYTEVSPSSTGVKLFFEYQLRDLGDIRTAMKTAWGKAFKVSGGEHPPAIEPHFGNRYFAVTGEHLRDTPIEFTRVPLHELLWLIEEAGPAFVERGAARASGQPTVQRHASPMLDERVSALFETNPRLARYWEGDFGGLNDRSRSGKAMALGGALKRAGLPYEEMCQALGEHPATASWVSEKGVTSRKRQLQRIWDKAGCLTQTSTTPGLPSTDVLKRTTLPCPQLHLSGFSPFWATWIKDAAEGANAPPDYTALPLLMLVSALLGNARHVEAWSGWTETAVLWGASVGEPSSGKTPGASPVMDDLVRKVEARMARNGAAFLDLGGTTAPTPCVRVGNTTIEQLLNLINDNPKGLICHNDELAHWFFNFDRYGGSDRAFWLQANGGKSYRLDRVKHANPINISHLSVAIFGSIQPDRLNIVLKGADDGLVGRFLWAWPERLAFRRPGRSADIDAAAYALFRIADLMMVADTDGHATPVVIPISEASQELFHAFVNRLVLREDAAHGLLKGAVGKARGQTLRLALGLHYLRWSVTTLPEPTEVQEDSVVAAISLMENYFLPMAERVFGDAAVPQEESRARTLARWIVETRPTQINVTDIRDTARLADLRESKDVKAACQFLSEANWLISASSTGQRGRPRGDYTVHPQLWDILGQAAD